MRTIIRTALYRNIILIAGITVLLHDGITELKRCLLTIRCGTCGETAGFTRGKRGDLGKPNSCLLLRWKKRRSLGPTI